MNVGMVKGYPHELKGEEIPLLSRIFSVVDVYDAITQSKPHRKAMCLNRSYIDFLLENKKAFNLILI